MDTSNGRSPETGDHECRLYSSRSLMAFSESISGMAVFAPTLASKIYFTGGVHEETEPRCPEVCP